MIAWIAVFLPAAVRVRRQTPTTTTEVFKRRMKLIAPMDAGGTQVRRKAVTRLSLIRKRNALTLLLGVITTGVLVSGVLSLLLGGAMWEVHLSLLAALGLYLGGLLELKRKLVIGNRRVRAIAAHEARRRSARAFHERMQASGGESLYSM